MDVRKIQRQLEKAQHAALLAQAEIGILTQMLQVHADFEIIVTELSGDGLHVMDESRRMPVGEPIESVITRLKKQVE